MVHQVDIRPSTSYGGGGHGTPNSNTGGFGGVCVVRYVQQQAHQTNIISTMKIYDDLVDERNRDKIGY